MQLRVQAHPKSVTRPAAAACGRDAAEIVDRASSYPIAARRRCGPVRFARVDGAIEMHEGLTRRVPTDPSRYLRARRFASPSPATAVPRSRSVAGSGVAAGLWNW